MRRSASRCGLKHFDADGNPQGILAGPDLLRLIGNFPISSIASSERRRELLDALKALPEQYRLVVTCRYLLELDEQETATVLGWPRGTVKSRLYRALRRLRSQLPDREVQR